jgi:hypothetical protein
VFADNLRGLLMRNDFSQAKNFRQGKQEEFSKNEKHTTNKRPEQECAHSYAESPKVFCQRNDQVSEENNRKAIEHPAYHLVFVILANEHIQFQE